MQFRHEWKFEINASDRMVLSSRLKAICQTDPHAVNGFYEISSLYFDTAEDTALYEKLDGVNQREKYRIRYYNDDLTYMNLEKKSKLNSLCHKETAQISADQVRKMLDGDLDWTEDDVSPVLTAFRSKMATRGLRPKTIVRYTREPYVFAPGNVRIAIDDHIRTALSCEDFLNPAGMTLLVPDDVIILEVKWDAFLPDIIRDAVLLPGRSANAFSKYAECRLYG